MKTGFVVVVFLHGLIHVLGFVKGFGLKEVRELTLPISRPVGVVWLSAAILFLTYGVLHLLNAKYAWLIGLMAVVVSQVLIVAFWKDAKFGTLPNILILAVALTSMTHYSFQKRIRQETRQLLEKNVPAETKTVTEKEISALPAPVKKWLTTSGALGKPFTSFGKVTQKAEMQMKPDQEKWMSAAATQYTTIAHPGFIWSVDTKMNGLLRFRGRDKFEDGRGEMLIKLNSLINVVDAHGEKLDEGSLQRYLGEMVWFPSLALSPYVSWESIDDCTAKATMAYKGTSGSGTFYFNPDGDVTRFSALRYKGNEEAAKRYPWEMNISEYKTFEGIKVPSKMTSTWKLEDQDWTWLKLEVTDITYHSDTGS